MQRLGNLNGENITYDHDISGLMRGLIDGGVIEGGTVVGNKLQPVQAIVPLVRSNGQKILAFFESDEVIDLPTTGDYKVYIEVDQSKVDFGGNNAEDGTGIASIKTGPSVPSQNFLLLATATGGVVRLDRTVIPKVGQLAGRIAQVERKTATTESKVERLEEAGTSDHLGIKAVVAEVFKENDEAYEYHLPLVSEVVSDCPIGKTNQTKEIHIPRVSTGVSFNTLEVYLKKVGEPSQNLVVEIRKAKKVTASGVEYVMGGDLLASGTVPHTEISTTYQPKTVILNKSITVTKDEFVIIVLKQQNETVNASNYFCIGVSKNPSLGYGVICVEAEGKYNKTYANVVCNSQGWYSNGIFGLSGSGSSGEKKRTLPDRYNFANGFPKNAITEIVAPADELTVKIKVKCSNWKNSGYGNTGGGFHVKLGSQILTTYSYSATAEISKTVVISTKLLEKLELYIQGDSVNYSTFYTGCDVDISREILVTPGESLARTLYSRKNSELGEKGEFTVLGYHSDRTWKEERGLSAGPFTVAFTGTKSGNSTENNQFKCPKKSFCKMNIRVDGSYGNNAIGKIKLKKNGVVLQELNRNSNGESEIIFLLPQGIIDVELYSRNNAGGSTSMYYTIQIQSDLSS